MKNKHEIYLKSSARYWDDGLPLGNGRLGAMIMGKVNEETIFINEETLWYGKDKNRKNPDTLRYLPKIRKLLQVGKVEEAQFLAKLAMTSTPKYMNPYQPAGDMRICIQGHKAKAKNYKAILNIDEAIATVCYYLDGYSYKREHFVSQKYNVFATKITTNNPNGITFSVNMSRKPFEDNTEKIDKTTTCNYGQCGVDGIKYFTAIKLDSIDGEIDAIGDFIYIKNTSTAYIYLTTETNFDSEDYKEKALKALIVAKNIGYENIKNTHLVDFGELYNRMDLSFGKWDTQSKDAKELLQEIKDGNSENLPFLVETMFHFARYLMISSSYNCKMPSNLQGIWNGEYVPPWQSEFTININTEMNYWIAEKCNLPECHMPLFDLVKRMVPKGQKTAKELYNCRGFCAHHNTNIWANTDPEGIFDASPVWSTGAAWLSLHFYEHYKYTLDEEYLEREAFPVMREAVRFYLDYLIEDENGFLITGPSVSPENTYKSKIGEIGALAMGPTMDTEILHQLFKEYMECCKILGENNGEEYSLIEETYNKLPPIQISRDGSIMEWQEDYEETELGHRHISHLFALHPGYEITEDNEALFDAAKKTLEKRLKYGGGHTGWSRAWIICFYARLKNGESLWDNINKMMSTCIKNNLLDTHPPFQIDGNFGLGEGILESLAQSHGGYLEFLPALPKDLPCGQVTGMVLQGNIIANFSWKEGFLTSLELFTKEDKNVDIKISGLKKRFQLKKDMINSIIRRQL
ncbi:MAG: glycosyl hydrolase family 95 catalytic domain-containing protein [Lachnospirales bacterium]